MHAGESSGTSFVVFQLEISFSRTLPVKMLHLNSATGHRRLQPKKQKLRCHCGTVVGLLTGPMDEREQPGGLEERTWPAAPGALWALPKELL